MKVKIHTTKVKRKNIN